MVNKKYLLLTELYEQSVFAAGIESGKPAPLIAAEFPEELLVRFILGEQLTPGDTHLIDVLKSTNEFFVHRIGLVSDFLKSNAIKSVDDYERYNYFMTEKLMMSLKRAITIANLPLAVKRNKAKVSQRSRMFRCNRRKKSTFRKILKNKTKNIRYRKSSKVIKRRMQVKRL